MGPNETQSTVLSRKACEVGPAPEAVCHFNRAMLMGHDDVQYGYNNGYNLEAPY